MSLPLAVIPATLVNDAPACVDVSIAVAPVVLAVVVAVTLLSSPLFLCGDCSPASVDP